MIPTQTRSTLTLDDLVAVNRLSEAEREQQAAAIVADLREIEPIARGGRDRAGIATRGRSVYDEVLASKPRTGIEIGAARWALLSLGCHANVIDALELAEVTRP